MWELSESHTHEPLLTFIIMCLCCLYLKLYHNKVVYGVLSIRRVLQDAVCTMKEENKELKAEMAKVMDLRKCVCCA